MPLIYITGPTAAGKSTVCKDLSKLGYESYDTDEKGMRFWINKKSGKPVEEYKKYQHGNKWHSEHRVGLSPDSIKQLKSRATEKDIFICGTNANDLDLTKEFTKIILLSIEESEQKKRINNRSKGTYGADPKEIANALKWRQPQIDKYKSVGAHEIDATLPSEKIVERILSIAREP